MVMNTNTLTLAIIGHLVGDYLLQNDWMALNKKARVLPCVIHCFLWATAVCLFAGWGLAAWCVLFGTHYFQDNTDVVQFWMTCINRQQKFLTGPCAPWSGIVVDNVWHIVTIWSVWRFLV